MTTNDSADVESLAGMVAVLDGGRLVQFGDTAVVRRLPVNLPAAVATGPLSLIEMTVVAAQQGFWLQREDPAGGELIRIRAWSPALADHVGTKVTVGLRPEDVEIADTGTVPATIRSTAQFGAAGVACLVAGVRVGRHRCRRSASGDRKRRSATGASPRGVRSLRRSTYRLTGRYGHQRYIWGLTPVSPSTGQSTVQVPFDRSSVSRSPGPLRSLAAITWSATAWLYSGRWMSRNTPNGVGE